MGCVYLRGNIYWIKYHHRGKAHYESSKSQDKSEADRLLKIREGEIAKGKEPMVLFDKVKFKDLEKLLVADYETRMNKSLRRAKASIANLRKHFGEMRVKDITPNEVRKYISRRREPKKPAKNSTINRELAALRRMLNLGIEEGLVDRTSVPKILALKEDNVRQGFFEHWEFLAVRDALPEHLKGVVTFAYKYGWRVSEITGLTWSQVDLGQRIVWLKAAQSKNKKGRMIFLDDELVEVFTKQWEKRKEAVRLLPYVFLNAKGTDKIKRFDKAWKTACREAGIGKRLFHDFRRTAVRNMIRAGIPEVVAMQISGHKTRSVFDRYNIVSERDLQEATTKLGDHLRKAQIVTKTVTVVDFEEKRGLSNVS